MDMKLEDLATFCYGKFGLRLEGSQRDRYLEFAERRRKHSRRRRREFDINTLVGAAQRPVYFHALADDVMVMAYLLGDLPIWKCHHGKVLSLHISDEQNLYLLKPGFILANRIEVGQPADSRLRGVYERIQGRAPRYRTQSWKEAIQTLGRDALVQTQYGHCITYLQVQRSQNPDTQECEKKALGW